ncbi:hypothetical protein LguiB_002706 [Lonicera macranthoides]
MADEHCNTDTEEGTIAIQKKRSRRVSFAENTMVHIFDRDDEYETPPDPKPSDDNPLEMVAFSELGFHQDEANDSKEYSQNEEEDEEEDVDEIDSSGTFLRPVESPSSGSIIGSATSNDDFFGPVSASFIRPGQLSDSTSSDENNDVTKDSTFFSMHFRSLARSDSGGDLKTSTSVHLSFEEKTPTQDSIPTNLGSSMVLTVAKKPNPLSSTPSAKLSSGNDSNDMSLVGESPNRYDFGRLSPELDALLAEGSKDLHAVTISDNTNVSKSPSNVEGRLLASKEHEGGLMDLIDDGDNKVGRITHGMPKEGMPIGMGEESVKDASEIRGSLLIMDIQKLDGFTQLEYKSPSAGFIFSAKPSEMLLDTIGASKSPWMLTPSQKQIGSLIDEKIIHSKSAASIQKSISRLTMLEASPFYPTPGAKINNSTVKSLDYLFKTPPLENVLDQNSEGSQVKYVQGKGIETPQLYTFPRGQLVSIAQKKGEQRSLIDVGDDRIEIPEDNEDVHHSEASASLGKSGSLSTLEDHTEKKLVTSGTNSLFSGTRLDYMEDKRAHDTPHKLFSSPAKRLEMSSVTSPENERSLSKELRPRIQHNNLVSSSPSKDTLSRGYATYASFSSKTADKLDSLLMEKTRSPILDFNYLKGLTELGMVDDREINLQGLQDKAGNTGSSPNPTDMLDSGVIEITSLPITESDNFKGSAEVGMMDERETNLHDLRDKSGNPGNSPIIVGDKEPQNFRCTIPDKNFETARDAELESELPRGRVKTTACGSASSYACSSEASLQKDILELFTQSPSRKEIHNIAHDDNIHSLVLEDGPSPNSGPLTNGFKNSSAQKRKNEEVMLQDTDHMKEISRIQRSPKHHKGPICDSEFLDHQNESNSGTSTGGQEMNNWIDRYSKFLGDTEEILSSSTDKLNLQAIDLLEDILVHMQRSSTYEILQTQLQSLKTFDPRSNVQHKRVAETRLFLHKILHERVKLQLMRMKRERLLKKVQLLNSGIQESQMLKLNYLPQRYGGVKVSDDYHQPSEDIREAAGDKTALGEALETSERRIMSLTNFFHTSCKTKGEPGCADTILSVNGRLVKRTRCRFIRLDSQLWVLESLEISNGHHNLVLNYIGFNTQRLNISEGPVRSISITNRLNDVNISKNLPDMDICTAFVFVLNAEATRKYVGPQSLAQETQTSNSLLGNLLDVAEEVHQARMELRNLNQTSFHARCAEQLDLQLCFVDFKSGRKAILTLDMSCLKRGIYPSDIVPCFPAVGSKNSLSEPLLAEIRGAIRNLGAGYYRIIRLCRCISQVVQASTR